ncbi:MAG: ABC transporter ATP-binding protein [Candidatus Microthrix parvicella]
MDGPDEVNDVSPTEVLGGQSAARELADEAITDAEKGSGAAADHQAPVHLSTDPQPGEPILVADDLIAGYVPGVNILNGCSAVLKRGEMVGIIGPNGAGKSTLLKAMFGLINITSGVVSLRGENITSMKAHQLVSRGVGFVPQTENVFAALTVRENMEMGAFLRPSVVKERFEHVADLFPRLGERASQQAGSLSGGERQMVAMGRALMMEPSVLLLDEPSAGLSPAFQDEVFINCRRINATGVSILMVEQNARRCLQVCDRAFVLDQGKNAVAGTGSELLHDPKVIELYLGTLAKNRNLD